MARSIATARKYPSQNQHRGEDCRDSNRRRRLAAGRINGDQSPNKSHGVGEVPSAARDRERRERAAKKEHCCADQRSRGIAGLDTVKAQARADVHDRCGRQPRG